MMPGIVSDTTTPKKQHEGSHLLAFEGDRLVYVAIPPLFSSLVEEGNLCFMDHGKAAWDLKLSEMCCLKEAGHIHAHVHHGEITVDILLEQCLEEAGCALPMPWNSSNNLSPILCHEDSEHVHKDGCGHNRIAHGDHYDWLIPQQDGSYLLIHVQGTEDGRSQFIEHGWLVKVGKSLGQLKKQPKQLLDLFGYVTFKKMRFQSDGHPMAEEYKPNTTAEATAKVDNANRPDNHLINSQETSAQSEVSKPIELTIPADYKGQGMTKITFDIMGLCCPAEVGLVRKILEPLPGVQEVSINAAIKSATLLYDPVLITDIQIVKILNEANLDATIHKRGVRRLTNKWPSPWTIASGILLAVALFHYIYDPLKWVALASVGLAVPAIVIRSLVALRRFHMDINCLMLIAIGGAIALGDYVESGTLAFLFTLADWLESRSIDTARNALSSVLELAPQSAVLLDGKRVQVEHVQVGTLLAVKTGEHVPIDATVISGNSTVDESSVTGESKPVEKQTGQHVWAGTMNLSGYITIQTTALSKDSAVARMVHLVEEAQRQHSPTEQLVEKFALYYTPVVVIAALIIAVVPIILHIHDYRHWVYVALVLLVVACPCALVISTPVTTTCGIAQAAREGLIVKGGRYLEMLGKVKVVALDKTGTLTEGHFRVLEVHSAEDQTTLQQLLFWTISVENKSNHPLAPALISYCRKQGLEPSDNVTHFEVLPGEGVTAIVGGQRVYIGNSRLASRIGWQTADKKKLDRWYSLGATVIWIGVKEHLVGIAAVADQLRSEAVEAVNGLKALGVEVRMLTGDSAAAAAVVQSQLGNYIVVHSELLPEDKVNLIKQVKQIGVTIMVGDGINDAPALASADVGIAMGVAGSAIAMETADVALMTNNLCKIVAAIKLAAGHPSLWAAVFTDVGTCLIVIFNSMQLLSSKKKAAATSGHSHHSHIQDKTKSCCMEVIDHHHHLQNETKEKDDSSCGSGGLYQHHHHRIGCKDNMVKVCSSAVAHPHHQHHGCELKEEKVKRWCSTMSHDSHGHDHESKGETIENHSSDENHQHCYHGHELQQFTVPQSKRVAAAI